MRHPAETDNLSANNVTNIPDFRALVETAEVGMCVVRQGRLLFVNRHLAEMLGYDHAEQVLALDPRTLVHAADVERMLAEARVASAQGGHVSDVRTVRRDGSLLDSRAHVRRIVFDGRSADLVTLTDITDTTRALRTAEWRARMLAQAESLCRSGSIEVDLVQGRITVSAGMAALLGVPPTTAPVPRRRMLRWLPADERQYIVSIWSGAVAGEPFEFQHRVVRADGERLVVLHRGIVEPDAEGRPLRGVAILQDITAQREAERRIQELANYDDVTGLPNRSLLLDRVDEALHAARREETTLTLLALEIPQVERVKDSMGHPAGNALAMAIAARLMAACDGDDTVAHLGGGEFAVMIDPRTNADEGRLAGTVRSVQACLARPESVGNADVRLTCGFGIAQYPGDADGAEALLLTAQAALRTALEQDGEQVAFFGLHGSTRAERQLTIESALRHAIERDELQVHYQPQIDLNNGEIVGVEALLRWTSPLLGQVSPAEFIPVAEQSDLIVALGEWVLRSVCAQSAAWQRAGLPPLRVAVNLSVRQLERADFVQRVQQVLAATGADPSRLGVEVTESVLAADVETAARSLGELRALGVKISLDDFGTGYSNLSYLRTLPIDVIKIDRSFVHDVTASPADVSVTRAIITMAHSLQMKVLAEGAETEGQVALLISHGCDQMQGYYFSAPVPAEAIEAMQRENRRLPERFLSRSQRRRTVLFVDDEENILSSLRRLVRRDGYTVILANSAAEGLQRLAEHEVDVIVSDQRMPNMTGVEFLRRAKELYPDTVRMVLSGYTELQSITDAVNEGAIYKFLTKPWDDERLRAHIAEAFRAKEMADENRRLGRQVQEANRELAEVNQRLQSLLTSQQAQMSLEQGRAANAREVLENVPAPIIGFDDEGLVAFVNLAAQALLPQALSLLGRDADEALPPALQPVWRSGDGHYRSVALDGRRFRAVCRAIGPDAHAQGKLLVFTPEAADEPH